MLIPELILSTFITIYNLCTNISSAKPKEPIYKLYLIPNFKFSLPTSYLISQKTSVVTAMLKQLEKAKV